MTGFVICCRLHSRRDHRRSLRSNTPVVACRSHHAPAARHSTPDLDGRNTPSAAQNACDPRRGHGRTGIEAVPRRQCRRTAGFRYARASWVISVFTEMSRRLWPVLNLTGATRPIKTGTTASPWCHDAAADQAHRPHIRRCHAIFRSAEAGRKGRHQLQAYAVTNMSSGAMISPGAEMGGFGVPSFVAEWRARNDSNVRPSDS